MSRQEDGTRAGARRIEAGPALVGIALALAFLLRAALVVGSDFPLRDGGLFVTIPQDATAVFRVRDGLATWELLP